MTQQHAPAKGFDDLAADYERFRTGYSSELFDALESFGLQRGAAVLDAACGTGLSTEPLVARGMTVTGLDVSGPMLEAAKTRVAGATFVRGSVEELPFADASFDGAVCAQAFHWFDSDKAFSELIRVVKPGASVCVWWKILGSDDSLRELRAAAAARAGVEPSRDSLRGGFNAFYRAPFAERTLRVMPFVARVGVADWLGYERSRAAARDNYGAKRASYFDALQAVLIERYGSGSASFDVRYTQYLYCGQTAK